MIKEEFYFESACGTNKIHAVKWVPEGTPLCIVQIVHGKAVIQSYQMYVDAGMDNVSKILYPGKRHELLNESNKEEVMRDVYAWMQEEILKQ